MAAECECPEDHTITKLGHCRSCPYYRSVYRPQSEEPVAPGGLIMFSCGPTADHSHDFSWATYCDETQSYGVCECGWNAMRDALWNGS